MIPTLQAGAASCIITPELGTPMGGNARLDNYATGVLQELRARVLYLKDQGDPVVIVSLDLLGLWQADADQLREAVAARISTRPERVLVACTHTHSGPDTMQSLCWSDEKRERDTELLKPFWAMLDERVGAAAEAARDLARPAHLEWGVALNYEIAHNRRLRMTSGETRMNWELPPPEDVQGTLGPVDPQVTLLLWRGTDGTPLACLGHYACHPAILAGANLLFSGDWCGRAAAHLEEELGAPFLFLNGASGNINHIDYRRPDRGRGEEEVTRCAASFVHSVRVALLHAQPVGRPELAVRTGELKLPLRDIPPERLEWARELLASYDGRDISMADGVPPELNARRMLRLAEAAETGCYPGRFATMAEGKVLLPLQTIHMGPVVFAAAPAEVFVEFGLAFRQAMDSSGALVVGLANGLTGYIPTREAFSQGGYEPGLGPSYLPENAGEILIKSLIELAES